MLASKETHRDIQQQPDWILTPNFQRLILGYIRPGTYTREITRNLEKLKRRGENQSFPPYFDPLGANLTQILTQLETKKFVIHVRSASFDDNLWVLTRKGQNYLNPQEERQEEPKIVLKGHEIFNAKTSEKKKKKRERKSRRSNSRRAERQQQAGLKEQERLEKSRLREDRRITRRKEMERVIAENKERREREKQKKLKEREREHERMRAERKEKQRHKQEEREQRLRERKREKEKAKTKKIPEKLKSVQVELTKPESNVQQDEETLAKKLQDVENKIKDYLKKLKKNRYKKHLPVFKENDGQGVQVYLSPKGKLCYKPKDTEYVIDLDTALEVYGEEKIIKSIEDALVARGIK